LKGKPYFAFPAQPYIVRNDDSASAKYLDKQYDRIITSAKGSLFKYLHFRTIGAVEFQTVCSLWDGKGYHNVHAHTTGTGETAAQQRCVLTIESSM
jgi:hypothetical protein